jgi:hypothetical protein
VSAIRTKLLRDLGNTHDGHPSSLDSGVDPKRFPVTYRKRSTVPILLEWEYTMKLTKLLGIITSLTLPACAGVIITIQNPNQAGVSDDVLFFSGTLANDSADAVYLTAVQIDTAPILAIDDTAFFFENPGMLDGHGVSGTMGLFNVIIPQDPVSGLYQGTVTILGGPNPGDTTVLNDPATSFSVAVGPEVPEPSTILLLGIGLLAIGMRRRRPQSS